MEHDSSPTTFLERHGAVSRPNALEIRADLPFNDWRRIGEPLHWTLDRALWSLGDWYAHGRERYGRDYHHGLAELEEAFYHARPASGVARKIPPERRRELSFQIHKLVATLPELEQERWLDEVARQGWSHTALRRALEQWRQAVRNGRA